MLSSRPGVSARRTENVENLTIPVQNIRDGLAQELHGQVFESHGGAFGETNEFKPAGDLVESVDGDNGVREMFRSIGGGGQCAKVLGRDVCGVQADHFGGKLGVGQRPPLLELCPTHRRDALRHSQSSIGRQPGQKHIGEACGSHAPASGDEAHWHAFALSECDAPVYS